jgi:cytochrome P450
MENASHFIHPAEMDTPSFDIDLPVFTRDPYPALATLRAQAPIAFVPQLNATLITKRDDISTCEKNIAVFSSEQPGGLMNILMGENMMRRDGAPHLEQRKQAFPSLSPRTVRDTWTKCFEDETDAVLRTLAQQETCDLVTDYAMPVSAHALRHITGLTNLTSKQMDDVSQAMIDGISNYAGDTATEARCHNATALIDQAIDDMAPIKARSPDMSLLSILSQSGQPMSSIRANIKLAISGGQNEPRDAIAGTTWALLNHPEQHQLIQTGQATYLQAFEEYARWISPIGMSPRLIAKPHHHNGVDFEPGTRTFFMFSSGNRDEDIFEDPDSFQLTRDTTKSISFGAGPHFCAGAATSRVLIAHVALPRLFAKFPNLRLDGDVPFTGWAFRGPTTMPVTLG